MDTPMKKPEVSSPGNTVANESHYHSKKDRVFVRPIQGAYSLKDELKRLRDMPRVRKGREIKFNDGPQAYSRHYVEPKDGITQTFHLHLEEYGPGGKSQKHGHVNEAAFYILDGEGYEVHDGVRYDWKAGDVAIVHNNCVHQHFNASPTKPARARHQDEADVHIHEHALPAAGRAAPERPGARSRVVQGARGGRRSQSFEGLRRRRWPGVNPKPGTREA